MDALTRWCSSHFDSVVDRSVRAFQIQIHSTTTAPAANFAVSHIMCGITLTIGPADSEHHRIHEALARGNALRGPDSSTTFSTVVQASNGHVELRLTSFVLGLRGELTGQPMVGKRGVLAWNGQVS